MQYRGILLMFLSVVLFAGVNTCVKYLSDLPTHEIVFFRSVVQLALSAAFVVNAGLPFFGNNKPWLITRGISGMIALFLFFYTLQRMPMASATTIQYLSPIFTVLLAILINKERVKPIQWLFFLIAFSGVVMIKGFDPRVTTQLLLMGIGSAVLLGVSYNAIMKCKHTDHPVTIVMYFHLIAFPVMGIWTYFDWQMPTGRDWILLLVIALLSQVAQVAMAKALHADQAARVTPIKYFGSVMALIIGYTIFDERLNWLSFSGIALVMIGVIFNAFVKPVRVVSTTGA
jgi:drug/metabolite transporter (DMT)-like permease